MKKQNKKPEGMFVNWSMVKNKPFKLLLTKEGMIDILKGLGYEIEEDEFGCWLWVNKKSKKEVKWEITPTGIKILKKAHKLYPIVKEVIEHDSWLSLANKVSGSITDPPPMKKRFR